MDANILFSASIGPGKGPESHQERDGRGKSTICVSGWISRRVVSFPVRSASNSCSVHDTVEKRWRHLDFWQHSTELIARVPRVQCAEHGVLQSPAPWARPGSGFTLMMEAMILLLCQQMTVAAAAGHLGENDTRLWRVLEHYVMEAQAAEDSSKLNRLMVDETSSRRGHRYVTVALDADSHEKLLDGRRTQGKATRLPVGCSSDGGSRSQTRSRSPMCR